MSTRSVEVRLTADIRGFVDALRRAGLVVRPYVDARRDRIRRMHSAYGRKRGRGRW